jgi:hypothetical protein
MEASELTTTTRRLRLVCVDGVMVTAMGDANGEESGPELSESEGELELIRTLTALQRDLDPATDFRVEVMELLARLERRQARRRPRRS